MIHSQMNDSKEKVTQLTVVYLILVPRRLLCANLTGTQIWTVDTRMLLHTRLVEK